MQKYGKYSTHPVENISANFIGEPMVQGTFGITATRRKAVTLGLSRTFGASVASFGRLNLWYNCLQEKPTVSLRVISRREIIPSGSSYTWIVSHLWCERRAEQIFARSAVDIPSDA